MPSILDLNLGAMLVGALLGSVLFGAVTVQVYVYFQSSNDTKRTRLLVIITWVVECVWTITTWIYLYHILVTHYGNLEVLEHPHWTLVFTPITSATVETIVQGFFAYRIWVLSGRRIIPIVVSVITATQLAGCFAAGILVSQSLSLPVFASRYTWVVTSVFSLTLSADLLNTVTMCYYLRLNRRGITSTNRALDTLFLWTIQTGILLSITSMIILVFEQTLPATKMWFGVALFKGKLYSNNFMASLNGRNFLRNILDKTMNTPDASGRQALSTLRFNVQKGTHQEQVEIGATDESLESTPTGTSY